MQYANIVCVSINVRQYHAGQVQLYIRLCANMPKRIV